MENPPDRIERPEPGMLLHTIRVESHVNGLGFEIKVRQGKRLNQIVAETFGRASKPHGCDWLAKHLRERLVTRWLHAGCTPEIMIGDELTAEMGYKLSGE